MNMLLLRSAQFRQIDSRSRQMLWHPRPQPPTLRGFVGLPLPLPGPATPAPHHPQALRILFSPMRRTVSLAQQIGAQGKVKYCHARKPAILLGCIPVFVARTETPAAALQHPCTTAPYQPLQATLMACRHTPGKAQPDHGRSDRAPEISYFAISFRHNPVRLFASPPYWKNPCPLP